MPTLSQPLSIFLSALTWVAILKQLGFQPKAEGLFWPGAADRGTIFQRRQPSQAGCSGFLRWLHWHFFVLCAAGSFPPDSWRPSPWKFIPSGLFPFFGQPVRPWPCSCPRLNPGKSQAVRWGAPGNGHGPGGPVLSGTASPKSGRDFGGHCRGKRRGSLQHTYRVLFKNKASIAISLNLPCSSPVPSGSSERDSTEKTGSFPPSSWRPWPLPP